MIKNQHPSIDWIHFGHIETVSTILHPFIIYLIIENRQTWIVKDDNVRYLFQILFSFSGSSPSFSNSILIILYARKEFLSQQVLQWRLLPFAEIKHVIGDSCCNTIHLKSHRICEGTKWRLDMKTDYPHFCLLGSFYGVRHVIGTTSLT